MADKHQPTAQAEVLPEAPLMGSEKEPQRHLHVIPVPEGMTPEESWAEIVTMGRLVEPDEGCTWAGIECDGLTCIDIEEVTVADQPVPVALYRGDRRICGQVAKRGPKLTDEWLCLLDHGHDGDHDPSARHD